MKHVSTALVVATAIFLGTASLAVAQLTAEQAKDANVDFTASRVTIDVTNKPLAEVMAELARQSGNEVVKVSKQLAPKMVTVKLKDVTYWEAIDKICETAGCYVTMSHEDPSTPVLQTKAREAEEIGAYAGPGMVKLMSVERLFRQERTFRGQWAHTKVEHKLTLDVQAYVEDRLPVLKITVIPNKVTGRGGEQELKSSRGTSRTTEWMWPCYISELLQVAEGEERAEGPLTVEGVLEVTYGVGKRELIVEDILAVKGQEGVGGEVKLKVTKAGMEEGKFHVACEMEGGEGLAQNWASEGAGAYGFCVVDGAGKRYERYWSMSYTFLEIPGGRKLKATMEFPDVPKAIEKCSLVLVYPAKTVKKEYPFKLEGVPLPVGEAQNN